MLMISIMRYTALQRIPFPFAEIQQEREEVDRFAHYSLGLLVISHLLTRRLGNEKYDSNYNKKFHTNVVRRPSQTLPSFLVHF